MHDELDGLNLCFLTSLCSIMVNGQIEKTLTMRGASNNVTVLCMFSITLHGLWKEPLTR